MTNEEQVAAWEAIYRAMGAEGRRKHRLWLQRRRRSTR